MKCAVLASTRGTTFQAVLDAKDRGEMPDVEITLLLSNTPDAYALERAKKHGVPTVVIPSKGKTREVFDREVVQILREHNIDFVALMGFMRIFSPLMVQAFANKIVNVHPSLLPKHGGKGMYGVHVHAAVLAAGEKESGCSFHLVDEGCDTGPIIRRVPCPVEPDDTPETLAARVQALEREWYPKILQSLAQ